MIVVRRSLILKPKCVHTHTLVRALDASSVRILKGIHYDIIAAIGSMLGIEIALEIILINYVKIPKQG